eukprot:gnl/MRDRNA2_/MRDRNA2_125736_c0_seq1.p1 gnl/MRDRNA2_/MRDRNA2_125736_c0~~gnl/MRDRNA2_/MRDRNA2_125736_c0_seq1.p1  ORF type:complete len:512 (+),score=105.51 gnl/MRDRNA2_/MRDRNA2_125736_c0_seq1:100-1635(+)
MGCGASVEAPQLLDFPEEEMEKAVERAIRVDIFQDEVDAASFRELRENPKFVLPGTQYKWEPNIAEIERRENSKAIEVIMKITDAKDVMALQEMDGKEQMDPKKDPEEETLKVLPWSRLCRTLNNPGRYELVSVQFNGVEVNWRMESNIGQRGVRWEDLGAVEGSVVECVIKPLVTQQFIDDLLDLHEKLVVWDLVLDETDEEAEPRLQFRKVPPFADEPERLVVKDWNLSGLGLTELPESIASLEVECNLVFSNNQLRELPPTIGFMKASYLDLSNNELQSLPEELFTLWGGGSCSLNLANNELTSLPASIGKFQIKKLDLSGNKLEMLPAEFAELQCTCGVRLDGQRGSKSTEDLIAGLESSDTLKIISDMGEMSIEVPEEIPEPERKTYVATQKREKSMLEFWNDFTGVTYRNRIKEISRRVPFESQANLRPGRGRYCTTPAQHAYKTKMDRQRKYRALIKEKDAMLDGPEKEEKAKEIAARKEAGEFSISAEQQAHIDNHWSRQKRD